MSDTVHKHWILGNWHLSVDLIDGLWSWRVDDLAVGLDPLSLEGSGEPDLLPVLVKALDMIADFEAVGRSAINLRSSRKMTPRRVAPDGADLSLLNGEWLSMLGLQND